MSFDFNKFGKSTTGGAQVQQPTETTSTAIAERPTASTGGFDFNKFGKANIAGPTGSVTKNGSNIDYGAVREGGNSVMKTMVGAPLTMAARPVQLGMAMSGMDENQIDASTQKYFGDTIAPVVRGQGEYGLPSANDMTKEVGRAAQTVSFGMGGPGTMLASGALMGAGTSLENQGTDAFTTPGGAGELAFDTTLGMIGGKVIDKAAGPVLRGAGKFASKVAGPAATRVVSDVAGNVASKVGNVQNTRRNRK